MSVEHLCNNADEGTRRTASIARYAALLTILLLSIKTEGSSISDLLYFRFSIFLVSYFNLPEVWTFSMFLGDGPQKTFALHLIIVRIHNRNVNCNDGSEPVFF